jgi:hypothetical protein
MSQVPVIRRKSLSDELQAALSWVESLGISPTGSRFLKYASDLKLSEGRLYLPIRYQLDSSDSAIEASDLVLIHKGLSAQKSVGFREKLMIFLFGPVHAEDERPQGSSHKARDTALELVIGSHFALGGFEVNFDTETDLIAVDSKSTFYIECKRPSVKKTEKIKKELYSQLARRYALHSLNLEPRGLAVISLNKLLDPAYLPLRVDHPQQAVNTILPIINRFLDSYERLWYWKLDDRTMAVMAYVSTAVSLGQARGIYILRQFGAKYVSKIHNRDIANQDPDRVYMQAMLNRLNEGTHRAFREE